MKYGCLISVVIPVYNVKDYIVESLESVIHQTYSNLEIIIIDDGSTDDSQFICEKYKKIDARIIVVHQENKGLSASRNVGLDMMNGEAVVFLDSDDAYHPNFIRTMIETMINEQSDIVVCKYTVHRTIETMIRGNQDIVYPIAEHGMYDRPSALKALAEGSIDIHVWNKIYKKELWNDTRFPEGHVYEDMDTTFRIFNLCKSVYVLNQALVLYRKRPNSITKTMSWDNICDRLVATAHFTSFVVDNKEGVFTDKQKNRRHLACLNSMIILYCYYYDNNNNEDNHIELKDIDKIIMDKGKEINIANGGHLVRVVYFMLQRCPSFMTKGFKFYHASLPSVKKVFRYMKNAIK
ncbi:MAG: glycosyltransferase family 2 protein [Eubacterium sp.]|nr:glycosyltransferase family 2 protein [Eubacterium sp.]